MKQTSVRGYKYTINIKRDIKYLARKFWHGIFNVSVNLDHNFRSNDQSFVPIFLLNRCFLNKSFYKSLIKNRLYINSVLEAHIKNVNIDLKVVWKIDSSGWRTYINLIIYIFWIHDQTDKKIISNDLIDEI